MTAMQRLRPLAPRRRLRLGLLNPTHGTGGGSGVPAQSFRMGVNFSGLTSGGGSQEPPVEAADYYFTQKKFGRARICFDWAFIQPATLGALNAPALAQIVTQIERAIARGAQPVIEMHNYGRLGGSIIGESSVTAAMFADVWGKMANALKVYPTLVFELMNEPYSLDPTTWAATQNTARAAIRATGSLNKIAFTGPVYNALGWDSAPMRAAMLSVSDPLDSKPTFAIHLYPDQYSQGGQTGVTAWSTKKPYMDYATDWARSNGRTLYLSEYHVPNSVDGLSWLNSLIAYLQTNADVWTMGADWWGAGGWWPPSYTGLLDPTGSIFDINTPGYDPGIGYANLPILWANPVDQPQMGFLQPYLPLDASAFNGADPGEELLWDDEGILVDDDSYYLSEAA